MSDIEELQRRITVALDRIGSGLDGMLAGGGADPSELEALQQQLADEKLANEQLQERLKTVNARHQAQSEAAEAAQAQQAEALRNLDADLQSLRKVNQQLRDNNQALREANEAGVAEPHLINKAMLAELEGLRASRAADRAEANAVMADLVQLIDDLPDTDDEISKAEDA